MTLTEARQVIELFGRYGNSPTQASQATGTPRTTLKDRFNRAQQIVLEAGYRIVEEQAETIVISARPRVRVQAGKPGGTKYRVMAIGDTHDAPKIPKDRFRWLGKLAGEERPDVIIQIGDMLTLDSLNTHIPDETFEGRLKGTYLEDIASGNQALGEFSAALPGGYEPRRHITLGNHERRIWRAENSAPHVAGMMQLELTSMLERNKWTWSEYGEFWFLGSVGFVHVPLNRLGKTYGGKTSENQIANDAVFDIVFGHSHTRQVKMAPKIGPQQHVMVVNLGCALPHGLIEDYALHAVTGWTYGCEMITIQGGHITQTNFVSMASLEEKYS